MKRYLLKKIEKISWSLADSTYINIITPEIILYSDNENSPYAEIEFQYGSWDRNMVLFENDKFILLVLFFINEEEERKNKFVKVPYFLLDYLFRKRKEDFCNPPAMRKLYEKIAEHPYDTLYVRFIDKRKIKDKKERIILYNSLMKKNIYESKYLEIINYSMCDKEI